MPRKYERLKPMNKTLSEEGKKYALSAVAHGISLTEVASIFDLSAPTLEKILTKKKIEAAKADLHYRLAKNCYELAFAGEVGMNIFLAKTQLKWRETPNIEDGDSGIPNIRITFE